ncbi:hypothetical protein CRYUN_Cryun06bG0084300 [Craigia yunnanensis]
MELYELKESQNIKVGGKKKIVGWKSGGWLKINCDGAFDQNSMVAGLGVVVRNGDGMLVEGRNRSSLAMNALQIEAMAVKEGVKLAIEKKFQKVEMEMDSREIHLVLTKKSQMTNWRIRPLVLDIQKKCWVLFENISWSWLEEKQTLRLTRWLFRQERGCACLIG